MRIPGLGIGKVEERELQKPAAGKPSGPAPSITDNKGSVIVRTGAMHVVAALGQNDAERATRVKTVRNEIQTGQYAIDKDALAENIVEDELARAGR